MNSSFDLALLAQIKVVLVRTFHPGNIGSAVRAMKTMGLERLHLVDPVDFPSPLADSMAAGAVSSLADVVVVGSLREAVADCSIVVACSARSRSYDRPLQNTRQCASVLLNAAQSGPVALVFGPERQGLTNEDLEVATHRVCIDANPDYSSLNLASAVQILSYELRQACQLASPLPVQRQLPDARALDYYFDCLEATFSATGFVNSAHPGELQKRLRQLYARAEIDQSELNILQGMLSSIENSRK